MAARAEDSRLKLFVLLDVGRWALTAAILVGVFATLIAVGTVAPVSLQQLVTAGDPVGTLFQALVTAIITGVTLVVTITQLVVSQELGPLGDQRERMEGAMAFRDDAEDLLDVPVSPHEPAAFLGALLDAARARGNGLHDRADGVSDPAGSRLQTFSDALVTDATWASERLEDVEFGTYGLLSVALDFNYSTKLYDARRLRAEYESDLPGDVADTLEDVVSILATYAPAREHVKTLYFQWALSNLSREILYVTLPALLVSILGVLYLDAGGTVAGVTLGIDNLVWVVSAAATVAVAPFALLIAYVLRIATVAKRTLAIGPFTLRSATDSAGIDWDRSE